MWVNRTLVVGTTPDYIEIIRRRFPGRAFFLSDKRQKRAPLYMEPMALTELQADLERTRETLTALKVHFAKFGIRPVGITCYDCESLGLAADIAEDLGLTYPSRPAVDTCRDKYLSKVLWRETGLACPEAALMNSEEEAAEFMDQTGGPAVCKPLTGSGSELVFFCDSKVMARNAFRTLNSHLASHQDRRMYSGRAGVAGMADPRRTFVIEEFVNGTEFSCDFILDGEKVEIIRIARKIPAKDHPIGTVLAYVLPGELPPELDPALFRSQLLSAGRSLGLEKAVCMLDFIVRDGQALMIEMAPRIGGDCLPPLTWASSGLDMIGLTLAFAEGLPVKLPLPSNQWRPMVGLHLLCGQAGVVGNVSVKALEEDPRVRGILLKYGKGHKIVLPPLDYDSWILGHVIFEPSAGESLERQCRDLLDRLEITMEADTCLKTAGY